MRVLNEFRYPVAVARALHYLQYAIGTYPLCVVPYVRYQNMRI